MSYWPDRCNGRQFWRKTQNTKKNYFYLVANLQSTEAKSRENCVPQNGKSTQLINVTSCVKVWVAKTEEEELAHISSYQTFTRDKNRKVTKPEQSIKKELHNAHIAANSFTPMRVQAETKNPAPYIFYSWKSMGILARSQTLSPWCAVCPSHCVYSIDHLNPTYEWTFEGVCQRRPGWV